MATAGPRRERRALSPAALFAPVDASSIVFFRVTFGLLTAWSLRDFLLTDKVRVYTEPRMLFKFYGFGWIEPGPEWAMKLVFWITALAALGIAAGLWYRVSAVVFLAGKLYVFLLETARVNNHDYLICLLAFLLVFVPAHRAGSLDAARRPRIRSPTMPSWALWLLRFQVGVPYFFGGLAKLNGDWLLRAQPMSVWIERGSAKVPELFQRSWGGYFFSWGGIVFDLLIVPLLLYRRTRLIAYALAVGFHLTNAHMFNIGVFPWLMICATTIFLAPDWPKRAGLVRERAGGAQPSKERLPRSRERLAAALLGVWVAVQVVLPFRHYLYSGNVDWTEEGHYFGWRMKLRDKQGTVRFAVVDRNTKKATVFRGLEAVLTRRQHQRLVHDPDMILQFAHFLARELESQGRTDFEIRVLTSVAFNGRPPRPLIDPNVDLAAQPRSLRPAEWILPLDE